MTIDLQKIVLVLAGIDPSGGAGLLVDCKAISAVSCHPAGVPTVLTVQDGRVFSAAQVPDTSYVVDAGRAILTGLNVGAVKIGALKTASLVDALALLLRDLVGLPIVLDPVMLSTSGGRLLDEDAVEVMTHTLFSSAALVTPNLAEAALLARMPIRDIPDMLVAAERILAFGSTAVLVKGGHLAGDGATDVYFDANGPRVLKTEKKVGCEVRGTGCALSSLIAAWCARGTPMLDSVEKSRAMLGNAIRSAVSIGPGPKVLGEFV